MKQSGRPKSRRNQLQTERREPAALVAEIAVRVLNCSASGCLLELERPLPLGAVATLARSIGGETFSDIVRVVRCVAIDRDAARHHVAAEFLSTTPAYPGSLRHLMQGDFNELAEQATADVPSRGTNVLSGADNQNGHASERVGIISDEAKNYESFDRLGGQNEG